MTVADYVEQLVLELRMRDVPGDRIGQVAAEVEAHVAESGEDPADAFGPAGEYAEHVRSTLGTPPRRRPLGVLTAVPVTLAAMLGLETVAALTGAREVQVTAGHLIAAAAIVPAGVLLVRLVTRPLWQLAAAYLVAAAGVVAVLSLLRQPVLLTLPVWAGLAVAAVLGAVGATGLWWLRDPVVDPRAAVTTAPGAAAAPPAGGRRT